MTNNKENLRRVISSFTWKEMVENGLPSKAIGCALKQLQDKYGANNVVDGSNCVTIYKTFTSPKEVVSFLENKFNRKYSQNKLNDAYDIALELDQFLSEQGEDLLKI